MTGIALLICIALLSSAYASVQAQTGYTHSHARSPHGSSVTADPTATPAPTATPTPTPSPTPQPTATPNPSPTPDPTATPTPVQGSAPSSYQFTICVSGSSYSSTNTLTKAVTTSSNVAQLISNDLTLGSTTYVNAGTYSLTQAIVPQSNAYLLLASNAVISQPPLSSLSQSISLLATGGSIINFTVNGGTWNGNKGSLTDHRGSSTWSSYFMGYMGMYFGGGSNIVVENALIENVIDSGVYTYEVSNAVVDQVTVNNAGDNPITFNGNVNGSPGTTNGNYYDTAEYCSVSGGQDVGINTFHCDSCMIEYCTVTNVLQDSAAGASNWGIAAENSQNVTIAGNTVTQCVDDIVTTSNQAIINGNTINGTNNQGESCGIHVISGNANIVEYNTVENCQYALMTCYGDGPTNTQFIDNTVTDDTGNCRCVFGGDSGTIIDGGSIQTTNADGCISLRDATNITIENVVFSGNNGISDYGEQSTGVTVASCNFSALTGTKIDLSDSTDVTLTGNIGLS